MTISLRGSATGLTGGTTTALAFTLPTGHTTNDLLCALVGAKPYTVTVSSGTLTTDGWTARSGGANGTTANGVDSGSVYGVIYTKVHDGSESNPSGTLSASPSPRMSGMIAFQSTASGSNWTLQSTSGSDSTNTGSSLSATGAGNLSVASGDWLVVLVVHKTDAATHTSPSLSVGSATITNLTQRFATTTTTSGNDGAMYVYTADVTSADTAAPVFTATIGGTNVSDAQVVFLRISEPINKTGTVTGASTSSGSVASGKKAGKGSVIGSSTSTGTVVGNEQHNAGPITNSSTSSGTVVGKRGQSGTVTGASTSTGTVTGNEQHFGTVVGSSTSSGTATGAPGGETKSGTVTGSSTSTGTAIGAKGGQGAVTGSSTSSGTVFGNEQHFGTVVGTSTTDADILGTKGGAGTITGSSTSSGTVVGNEQHFGTVVGSSTSSGTVSGSKADPDNYSGTVTGSVTAAGTVAGTVGYRGGANSQAKAEGIVSGTKAATGAVDGSSASSGTVGPAPAPAPITPSGRGYLADFAPRRRPQPRRPRPEHKSGRVSGFTRTVAVIRGTLGYLGRSASTASTRCAIVGFKTGLGLSVTETAITHRTAGAQTAPRDPEYLSLYAELRRTQDDHDLLMML